MKNLTFILISLITMIMHPSLFSQSAINSEFFSNEKEEFLCIDNDTICFRILNNDAFGTYVAGKGKFKIDKKGKVCIHYEMIKHQNSILLQSERNDSSVSFSIIDINGVSFEYATIKITDNKQNVIFRKYSDKDGILLLSYSEIQKYLELSLIIEIETVGFRTEKIVNIKPGFNYIIKSLVADGLSILDIPEKEKISIKRIDSESIKIKTGFNREAILRKSPKPRSGVNLLFSRSQ